MLLLYKVTIVNGNKYIIIVIIGPAISTILIVYNYNIIIIIINHFRCEQDKHHD